MNKVENLLFIVFLLAIILSVLPWFTDPDYPFGIFKLFLLVSGWNQVYFWNYKQSSTHLVKTGEHEGKSGRLPKR